MGRPTEAEMGTTERRWARVQSPTARSPGTPSADMGNAGTTAAVSVSSEAAEGNAGTPPTGLDPGCISGRVVRVCEVAGRRTVIAALPDHPANLAWKAKLSRGVKKAIIFKFLKMKFKQRGPPGPKDGGPMEADEPRVLGVEYVSVWPRTACMRVFCNAYIIKHKTYKPEFRNIVALVIGIACPL